MHGQSPKRIAIAPESTPPAVTAPAPAPAVAFVALVLANVALAFGPWFVRLADTGPVAAAFWRITLAAPVLALAALATGGRPQRLSPALWGVLALAGLAFAADLGSWHVGIHKTTLANATLFGNSATLIFPIYGFLVARVWPTRMQAFALALAAVGAALLMGRSYQLDPRHLVGDLLCLLAGVLYTGYFILMARARTVMAPLSSLALATMASIVPLLLVALLLGERILPQAWGPLILLALVSQIIGQGLMIYALGKLSPLVVGIALLLQPAVAGIIGWIAYDERLGAPDFVGLAMVAVALVLVRRASGVAKPVPADDLGREEPA
ncbi:Threonine/homoserine efflux transporter RhtA [Sphingomonas sp. EC-HK361]|uniref:DMT family transporter n=1 Tax=Sphingomonas sp. EC-HK361 TaxID=2038397 RepID=UPI0012545C6D|nr:DMT family transporter [Sphingomonas sp. EC-HK361]VVS97944.1 Threonine/homoserine efflux transporter RhtA [Sphingomonas sp. EC-HK361]